MLAGIGLTTEAVLGRENGDHVQSVLQHQVERVLVAHDSGLIAQQRYSLAFQHGHIQTGASGPHRYLADARRHSE